MSDTPMSRRMMMETTIAAGAAASLLSPALAARPARSDSEPFGYCLNMSTIRGQELSLPDQVDLAAQAGYQAIEPWINELDQYVQRGGSLADLKKRIEDRGLTVESAIGFAEWIVDDKERRAKGLEEARRAMNLLAQIGGKRLAAPPVGATDEADMNLSAVAERYRALLELGDQTGITPQLEVWGFSKTLGKLSETIFVAVESGHGRACLLPDVYHLYKGGSDLGTLRLLSGRSMHVFHVNDYPAAPARGEINDSHRVYPGDGVAPLDSLFRDLRDNGFRGYLSLELFNRDYWRQDALKVAKTGLEKIKAAVRRALA